MLRFIPLIVVWCTLASFHEALGASIKASDLLTEEKPKSLQAIFPMFRHGDRSPINFWPTDPYLNYDWPGGHGALSVKGVGQLYSLGKNLKHRYGGLLPADGRYTQHNMLVRSSHIERCIMSGLSLLAGFMPPHESSNQLPIAWQPVPITATQHSQDQLLAQDRPCKKYDRLLQELYNDPPADLKKLKLENEDLYKLVEQSGRTNISFADIGQIYDSLIIHRDNGLSLPEWAKDIFPERMRPFAERAYSVWTETPYMKQVKGGAWITDVYEKMVDKQKKTLNPDRKIFFYASHDSTIIGVLNSLGVLDQAAKLPQYAALMAFELHTLANSDDFEVKLVYYASSEVKHPIELHLPNCGSPCTLTKFGAAVKPLLIDDFEKICEDRHY